jgi:DNA-binding winged helix-turn-helix (wHTH) protein/Tfp pilus assembly protein PilF
MNLPAVIAVSYRFGTFEAYPQAGKLLKDGTRVKLQEQPFRLLCFLLETPGTVVSREAVKEHLWPSNTFVEFDASLNVAVGKIRDALGDDSENPQFIETIPRKGYRFVAPVERTPLPVHPDRDTADRLPGADSIERTDSEIAAVRTTSLLSRAVRILLIVLLILGAVGYWVFRPHSRPPSGAAENITRASATPIRRSIAILGFRNLPHHPDEEWVSQAFTEMLGTELASDGNVRLVSDEDVAVAKSEMQAGEQNSLAKASLEKFARRSGADVVLLGSYTVLPGSDGSHIRLDARLQDTSTGETIGETAVSGKETDLFELASRAGADLRKSLGLRSLSSQDAVFARASLPSNQAAIRYYSEGRARQAIFDFVGAKDALLKAVAADPSYPLAHGFLADAWGRLGFESKAVAEAKRSLELSWSLPAEERLLLEGSYHTKIYDWPGAVKPYLALYRMRPDNLDYGLQLAAAQYRVNSSDSLATLHALHELPAPMGNDPRIDFVEAEAQMNHDFAAAQSAAARGIAKAEAEGAPDLAANGYGLLCQQSAAHGTSLNESVAACEKAIQIYKASGQADNAARTVNDMADVYMNLGDIRRAESLYRQADVEFRRTGDLVALAAGTNNIGDVLLKRAKLAEAQKMLEDSVPAYRKLDDVSGAASVTNDLGTIAIELGDLPTAEDLFGRAKAAAEQIGDKSTIAFALVGLGDVFFQRGDFAVARNDYRQAIDIRTQTSELQYVTEAQLALARISLEEGHTLDAETLLRKCQKQFHDESQSDDELMAGTALIDALVAQHKLTDAAEELTRDEPLAKKTQNRFAQVEFALARARRLNASSGSEGICRNGLEKILAESRAGGLFRIELETRLAIAGCEKAAGQISSAQRDFSAVEKSARSKGFELIARKAAASGG